jgi:4-hydroxybenzoate polyprenyltransferase
MTARVAFTPEIMSRNVGDADPEVEALGPDLIISRLPLVVALNHCLLKTHTSFERFAAAATRRPLVLLLALGNLLWRRPALNSRLAANVNLDIDVLPARQNLVAWLAVQKNRGREVVLLTFADQEVADSIAERFKVFDRVKGVDPQDPKGSSKASYLEKAFPNGFVYVGGKRADLKIWRRSAAIVLCDASPSVAREARNLGKPVEIEFPGARGRLETWISAIRLHQWVKNLLIFAPALLDNVLTDPTVFMRCVLGFALLGIVASSTYMLNDVLDLQADRHHWLKRARPFAAGDIDLVYGLALPPLGIVLSLLAAVLLSPPFAIALATYMGLNLSYSIALKRRPIMDVFTLASLYVLRLVMGIVLVGASFSPWLLCFAMVLFFSLAIAKRHAEILRSNDNDTALRHRGYKRSDEALTLALGVASGMASLIIMILYLTQEVFQQALYTNPSYLWAIPLGLAIWLGRIWFLAHRGEMHDDPVHFALHDPTSLLLGFGSLIAFAFAIK